MCPIVGHARDTRLDRSVAIKILPEAGAGDSSGVRAIVMEPVESADLSAQIARGPIPQAEAIALAKQIVDALEGALAAAA